MKERERQREDDERPAPASGGAGPTASFRDQADLLLTRGAAAIDRAVSGNSAAFLAANRQEGGQ